MNSSACEDVILLFGGTSAERSVSVASAQNLCTVLPQAALWFIAPNGVVHLVERVALLAHEHPFELDFLPGTPPFAMDIAQALRTEELSSERVIFIGLHGGEGENGALQKLLEDRQIAFTGSGSHASALAFDKIRAKQILETCGARIAAGKVVAGSRQSIQHTLREMLRAYGRIVIKPVAEGSSVGLKHLTGEADLEDLGREIAAAGVNYLAERFVTGREITVSVVERDGRSVTLPPSEILVEAGQTFDYAGKYLGKGSREVTPADLDESTERLARQLALTAHEALGCRGYSRTDMIVEQGGITFLETNTLPGLTNASFLPQQLQAESETLARFAEQQIELAELRRHSVTRNCRRPEEAYAHPERLTA